jgi:hypothetical protein
MVYTCPHRLEGKEGGIQPEQQVLMLQSRDRVPKPVLLIIPNLAHKHRHASQLESAVVCAVVVVEAVFES